jgi:hypothetical protein
VEWVNPTADLKVLRRKLSTREDVDLSWLNDLKGEQDSDESKGRTSF